MYRAIIALLVIAILVWVARRIWIAVLQLRVGAVPEGVDVPSVAMVADRGWQVTRAVARDVATIRVEHPTEGVQREWRINLREPGSVKQMEQAMRAAGVLVSDLSAMS